jgi:hypothetical protein|tara:strand:- start:56 stop:253 length:198 start_codon:yes stop_codon:yes gene_type:complete
MERGRTYIDEYEVPEWLLSTLKLLPTLPEEQLKNIEQEIDRIVIETNKLRKKMEEKKSHNLKSQN